MYVQKKQFLYFWKKHQCCETMKSWDLGFRVSPLAGTQDLGFHRQLGLRILGFTASWDPGSRVSPPVGTRAGRICNANAAPMLHFPGTTSRLMRGNKPYHTPTDPFGVGGFESCFTNYLNTSFVIVTRKHLFMGSLCYRRQRQVQQTPRNISPACLLNTSQLL